LCDNSQCFSGYNHRTPDKKKGEERLKKRGGRKQRERKGNEKMKKGRKVV
jgi:hypothetical protein